MENPSIVFVFEQYLQYCVLIKGFRPPTVRTYHHTLKLILSATPAKTIKELDAKTLEQMFMTTSVERNWSPYTFFTHHKNLKAFFNWAVARGYVRENPMKNIGRPRLPKTLPKALSEDQAVQVIDAAYNLNWYIKAEGVRNRAIIATFIFAGLRRKELCDLKRGDVDLERRKIYIYDAKWGRDRVVPINSRLHLYLSDYALNRDKRYRDCVHLFVGLKDHKPVGVSGLRRMFKRIQAARGIHITPHKLRHTYGTLAYRGSKDILGVSASMGHSNLKTTQVYVRASADDIRETVEAHPLNF
jgi:site-specific recombinase XerD